MRLDNFVKGLDLPYRGDCPSCGGTNSFSARLLVGDIVYNCFRASCKLKGRVPDEISIENVRQISKYNDSLTEHGASLSTFTIPNYFTSPISNDKCLRFMRRWGLLEHYANNGLELYYDPQQDRCVFPLRDLEKELKGATGRSLSYISTSRWYVYARIDGCPYKASSEITTETALIVEDPISAIHATSISDTISLLGTNLGDNFNRYSDVYSKLYIALDDDATEKSIELQKELSIYKPTYIIPLRKDIKYFSQQELEELRKEYLL